LKPAFEGDDFAIGPILNGVNGEAAYELIIIDDDDMQVCGWVKGWHLTQLSEIPSRPEC
jgi:hypothetical protein